MEPTKQDSIRAEIAKKVRTLREKRGLTQAELSKKLGMSQSRFSVVERGDGSFSAEQFVEILRGFGGKSMIDWISPQPRTWTSSAPGSPTKNPCAKSSKDLQSSHAGVVWPPPSNPMIFLMP